MFCCLCTNWLPTCQNSLGYIPLKQAWAYQIHFFCKSFTFWNIKVPKSGIKQLNSVNMPRFSYRNITNALFHAFLAFGRISKHYHSEIDDISGRYLCFTNISVSAKMADIIGLSRCWQRAVILFTHADNLCKKAQRSKSRQLSCSNASRCVFINKQTRWTMEHASAVAAETKASSSIRLIKNNSKILKFLQFEKF